MSDPPKLWIGQRIMARCGEDIVTGHVAVRSGNGQAVAISFDDGMIANCLNVLPVMWDGEAGTYRTLIFGQPVAIEPLYPSQGLRQ